MRADPPLPTVAVADRRFRRPTRAVGTAVVLAVSLALAAGFWLTKRASHPGVFGWYAREWFILGLAATLTIALAAMTLLRWLWSARGTSPDRSGRLPIRKRLLYAGLMVLPILVAAEMALRHLIWQAETAARISLAELPNSYHSLLQIMPRTQADGHWARSFRDRVHQRRQTAAWRIICLGGSTTWGAGVDAPQAWPALLEQRLRARGHDVEVINASFSWYTSAHSLVDYAVQMRYFDADVVIIVHGVNDLCRSFPGPGELPPEGDYGSYFGPLRNLLQNADRPNPSPLQEAVHVLTPWATTRFFCAVTGFDQRYYSALRNGRPVPTHPTPLRPPASAPAAEVAATAEGFPTVASLADHLDYLVQLVRRDGREVLLATQANVYARRGGLASDQPPHRMRTEFFRTRDRAVLSAAALTEGVNAVRRTILDLAQGRGVALVDLEDRLDGDPRYFVDDFHFSVEGNAAAADLFADALTPLLSREPPARHGPP